MGLPPARSTMLLAVLAFAPLLATSAPSYLLTSTTLNRTAWQAQAYVSNGYIGQRLPAEGFGYREVVAADAEAHDGTQGWPLFTPRQTAAMVAGFYDQQETTNGTNFEQTGGQQPISTLPTWSSLYVTVRGQTFSQLTPDDQISNWTQSMSLENGVVQTTYNWSSGAPAANGTATNGTATNGTSSDGSTVSLSYTIFAHRTRPNLGVVRLDITGLAANENISVTDVLDGIGAWRTTPVSTGLVPNYTDIIHSAVQPVGVPNVTAYITSHLAIPNATNSSITYSPNCFPQISTNVSTASLCYTFPSPGDTLTLVKYVGIATTDNFPSAELTTALNATQSATETGYDDLLSSHEAAWSSTWEGTDIIIPQSDEMQLATRASMFHLLTNMREGSDENGLGANSVAPAGLTSDSYAGQIFWDADLWMYPSLLALFPSYAQSINNYRLRFLDQARLNAQQYNRAGALYPWTGARYGNCTGVGPCFDYEYHLNNDIALAHWQYYAATGDRDWLARHGWPIISSVAEFWASHVVYNNATGKYDTFNETDPDEYANFKNNAAFTNAGISKVMTWATELGGILGLPIPENWTAIGQNITILTDPTSGIILEAEGFNGSAPVKQADVVLLEYPLEYDQSPTAALAQLDFYAQVTSPNGPGMTYSVFSIDASELSPIGCAAYTYLLAASQPYSRAPFYQFSEQTGDSYATNGGTNPAYTFLTGHGGFLQSFTHGFTGYRSRTNAFFIDPSLPPQLSNFTIRGLKWRAAVLDITVVTSETTISYRSGTGQSSIPVEVDPRNSRGGNYTLSPGQVLAIGTYATNGTLIDRNLAQCASVLTQDYTFNFPEDQTTIVAGQYALAAVDGSNATAWQPRTSEPSTMGIDLADSRTINGFHINWGSNPPLSWEILTGIDSTNLTSIASGNVTISAPYDAATAALVQPKLGNQTDITLPTNVTARYVNLTIAGSSVGDGEGGTVAEFAVLSA